MSWNSPPIGLYIHTPFCQVKCPYCDFYSLPSQGEEFYDAYVEALEKQLSCFFGGTAARRIDSVYFGGGTPNLLGEKRIGRILEQVSPYLENDTEITLEANPGENLESFFQGIHKSGVNRISLGLQSACAEELKQLGRRHTAMQAAQAVEAARKAGISNISLDLMLAIPRQTQDSLGQSLAFCEKLHPEHLSAYLLKLEPGTRFWKEKERLFLPEEEETCELYLFACRELERLGYHQYEISNFARPGKEGRHNLKYWHCEEYLGLGPGAHSFLEGKRFYYPRDLHGFLDGKPPVQDGAGGGMEEFCMLALRLREGLQEETFQKRFGIPLPKSLLRFAGQLEKAGYAEVRPGGFALTAKGFLVSNSILAQAAVCLEQAGLCT